MRERLADLTEDARTVLFAMIECFRKDVKPDMPAGDFREAVLDLMDDHMLRIVQVGDDFSLQLTPLGQALGDRMFDRRPRVTH